MERVPRQEKGATAQSIIHLPIPERLAYASRCKDSSVLFRIVQSFALDYIRSTNHAESERIEELLSPRFEVAPLVNILSRMHPNEELRALALIWSVPGLASTVHPGHVDELYTKIGRAPEKYHQLYAEAAPSESILLASCFSDLLYYAHDATQIGAILNILPEHCHDRNKPVLANKIFLEGSDSAMVRSWNMSDGGFYAEPDLSRRFDCADADCSRIRRIAKDAVALLDTNSSIIATARVPPSSFEGVRDAPKSSSLRYLLEYYSYSGQESMQYNMEDAWETYSVDVAPYLSHADRALFESIGRSSSNVEAIVSRLEQLLQEADYTYIQFSYLFRNPSITSVQDVHKQVYLSQIHRSRVRASIEDDLRLPFNDLTLREQRSLLTFISSCHETVYENACATIKRFGPNAARTFLALETDAAHGERILAFANSAEPAVAKQVFETFARIADTVDLSAQELANQLYKDDGQTVDAERVRNELVKRGSRILLDAESALTEDPSGVGILDELQRYEADTVLFTSLFSSAFKGKEASFEALRDLETQTCELADLSPDDRARMKQLLDQEWSKKPLEFLFPETGTFRFFILRRRGRIEGYMRFEDQSNTSRHANFLCVDHSLRGSGVGENVLREAIARAGRNVTLHAEFDAAIPAGSMYIERFGFVGTGIEEEDRDGNLVEWVRIARSDALLKQLPSRTASHEQLRQWARTEAPSPLILTTLEGPVNTMELGMLAALKRAKAQNQKYVLSRYLLEPLANGQERRTLVFDLPTPAASPSATKTQTSGGAKKRSTHPGSPAPHRDHYAE